MARTLCTLIEADTKPGRTTPTRSRGRFSYDRHVAGLDRTFAHRTHPTRAAPVHLTVILDRSVSMVASWHDTTRIRAVHAAATVFTRAAKLAGTRPHLHLFSDATFTLLDDTSVPDPHDVIRRSPHFHTTGGTRLHPTLHRALQRTIPPKAHHLIILATDGELDPHDTARCADLVRTAPRSAAFLPLLIGSDASLDAWREIFSGAHPVRTPEDLMRISQATLQHLRAGPWQPQHI